MSIPSESHSLEDTCSSRVHPLVPPDLTGRITKSDSQYCAAGSYGDVYRCQYHSERGAKEVAVKTFRFEFTIGQEDTNGRSNRMIHRELGIWKRLSHLNIVPFLGTVSGFGRLGNTSLVSSWMPNGTLQCFLLRYDNKLTVSHRLRFLLGIANGLQYLHSLSIVHGDLTCNNVLLDEQYVARLTDFGYASLVGEIPDALAYLQASTLRPGAVRWAAPEYFSSLEEMHHCTTKSDIYSFGNIALQALSGQLPWSEFQRDAVIVLQLAKGCKPRRPQAHPIDDQHWNFIEQCWSPVQGRPSAEHLVSCVLDFLRPYPDPQCFYGLLMSSEKSNLQPILSGPLLSPLTNKRFLPDVPEDVPCAFETSRLMDTNRQYDQLPTVRGGNPSTFPLPSEKPRTRSGSEDDYGNEATSRVGRSQSPLEAHNQNGSTANPDVSVSDTAFPTRPPPAHSKSGPASPPFLNTSIGLDHLSSSPFLYPSLQNHSQGTTAFGRDAAHESRDEKGGIWSWFSRSTPPARKTTAAFTPISRSRSIPFSNASVSPFNSDFASADSNSPTPIPPQIEASPRQRQQQCRFDVAAPRPFSLVNVLGFNSNVTSASDMPADPVSSARDHSPAYLTSSDYSGVDLLRARFDSGRPGHNHLSPFEESFSLVAPPSSQQESTNDQFLCPPETVPSVHGHSCRASGSRGGGDGTWNALSSNRASPYPSPFASPHVRYEELPNVALTGQPPSMLHADPVQPSNSAMIPVTVSEQAVTSERTAGVSYRRRKQDAKFLCPVPGCGSTFTRSFNLKGHMRSHNEERPFQCKWPGCGKGFTRQHDCKRHEQLHSNYRPFACEGCSKTFAHMDALNRHLRSEGGVECQRILDAANDSEKLPVSKTEEKGWPGMSVTV